MASSSPTSTRSTSKWSTTNWVPIKTGAGETDLQARGLFFKDYTFLKQSQDRNGLVTRLWKTANGAHLALFPNLNAADDTWRTLFRDVRFRKALAMSVDREAINQFLYFGLARPVNNTIMPQSPLWTDKLGLANTAYDPDAAKALLDEIGLEMGDQGFRKLPNGRDLRLVVETAGESSEQTDVLELVRTNWQEIGFGIDAKPSQRELLYNRIFSGEALMTIWFGVRERHSRRRISAGGIRADRTGPSAVAQMGSVHGNAGHGR